MAATGTWPRCSTGAGGQTWCARVCGGGGGWVRVGLISVRGDQMGGWANEAEGVGRVDAAGAPRPTLANRAIAPPPTQTHIHTHALSHTNKHTPFPLRRRPAWPPSQHLSSLRALRSALRGFARGAGLPPGSMPSANQLLHAGRGDIYQVGVWHEFCMERHKIE